MLGTCLSYRRNPGKLYSPGATMFLIGGKTLRQEITEPRQAPEWSEATEPFLTKRERYSTPMRPMLPLLFVFFATGFAQQPVKVLTTADYAHAEKFMAYNTTPLVFGTGIRPNWLSGDRFWYRVTRENGAEFMLVDPAKGTRAPAFDHSRLAAALSTAANAKYEAAKLPFQEITLAEDGSTVSFSAVGKGWKCTLSDYQCAVDVSAAATPLMLWLFRVKQAASVSGKRRVQMPAVSLTPVRLSIRTKSYSSINFSRMVETIKSPRCCS